MRGGLSSLRALLRTLFTELPVVVSSMLIGFVALGALGGAVGLFVGLHVHPPTAWFAMLEVGFPAAWLGAVLGLLGGVITRWMVGPRKPVDDDFAGTPQRW
jgi:hypothetical protein